MTSLNPFSNQVHFYNLLEKVERILVQRLNPFSNQVHFYSVKLKPARKSKGGVLIPFLIRSISTMFCQNLCIFSGRVLIPFLIRSISTDDSEPEERTEEG